MAAHAQTEPAPAHPSADELSIRWGVETNRVDDGRRFRSSFTIANRGDNALGTTDWTLYFNFARPIDPASVTAPVRITRVNGDFYKLTPNENFTPIEPGGQLRMAVEAPGSVIKRVDAPAGFDADVALSILAADVCVLVTSPEPAALADSVRTRSLAGELGKPPLPPEASQAPRRYLRRRMDPGELPAVLGDDYTTEILAATDDPKSARELSDQLGVPIATCYRRIDDLLDAGLLTEVGTDVSDRGRRTSVYRRTVDDLTVSFENGEVTVTATERPPLEELRRRVGRRER